MLLNRIILFSLFAVTVCGCNTPVTYHRTAVAVMYSLPDSQQLLVHGDSLPWRYKAPADSNDSLTIALDTSKTYQVMSGFGATLSASSAYTIIKKLNADQRSHLLHELFGPQGAGISFIRVFIGPSDFSPRDYTYPLATGNDSVPGLSLADDSLYLLPILKEILRINAGVTVMASAEMAPAAYVVGDSLAPKFWRAYAEYLAAWLQAMRKEGVVVHLLAPVSAPAGVGVQMGAEEQSVFIKSFLAPVLKQRAVNVQLIGYEGALDVPEYPNAMLGGVAGPYIAGIAFQGRSGSVSVMGQLHNLYPKKDIYFTELMGGDFEPMFSDNMRYVLRRLFIEGARNWTKSVLLGNLALNELQGPHTGSCDNCRGVVTIFAKTGQVIKNEEYYALAQVRSIRPGAKRLYSPDLHAHALFNVVYRNEDGSVALLLLNDAVRLQRVVVRLGDYSFAYLARPHSITTFNWK